MDNKYQLKMLEISKILFLNNVPVDSAKIVGSFIEELIQENQSLKKQLKEKDVIIDFSKSNSNEIDCQIRAILPFSKVYVYLKNEFFYFENYEIIDNSNKKIYKEGEIVKFDKNRTIYIATKDNKILKLTNVKAYGIFGKIKAWLKLG